MEIDEMLQLTEDLGSRVVGAMLTENASHSIAENYIRQMGYAASPDKNTWKPQVKSTALVGTYVFIDDDLGTPLEYAVYRVTKYNMTTKLLSIVPAMAPDGSDPAEWGMLMTEMQVPRSHVIDLGTLEPVESEAH